jgi:hypothetical protein
MILRQTLPTSNKIGNTARSQPLAVAIPYPEVAGGSSAAGSFYDASTLVVSGGVTTTSYQISISEFDGILVNLTPGVATLIETGLVTRVADGIAVIRATGNSQITTLRFPMTSTGGEVVTTFNGWESGSVAKFLSDEIVSMFVAGGTNPLFSVKNDSGGTYTPNGDCWLDCDMSGLAVALSRDGGATWSQANAPSAITPRHGIAVLHWGHDFTNAIARFRGSDGSINERAVIGVSQLFTDGAISSDLVVLTFAGPDLPPTVAPFSLVGEWIRQGGFPRFQQTGVYEYWTGAYAFAINQNYHAVGIFLGNGLNLTKGGMIVISGTNYYHEIEFYSGDAAFVLSGGEFDGYEDKFIKAITGDSGKPICVSSGGDALLVSLFTTAQSGNFIGVNDGDLANLMILSADADAGVSTGHTVTVAPDPTL